MCIKKLCQNCTAMQNTKGQQNRCEWLREAKAKVQTTAKYIQFDAWARRGTKRCNAKTR